MRSHKGFNLIGLMVGVATSAGLLLTIGELSSISKANFFKNESTLQLYVDARSAIEMLRQFVPMAGVGIQQPTSAQTPSSMQYSVNTAYSAPYASGGTAVLRDWVYVGAYTGITIGATPSFAYTTSVGNPSQPLWCAAQLASTPPVATKAPVSNNFMGLLQGNCYYGTNPGWTLTPIVGYGGTTYAPGTAPYYQGLCCANPNNTVSNCGAPVYSCGTSNGTAWAASVYQKLIQPVYVTPTPGLSGNASGDTLQVYFANRGPEIMQSYDGSPITPDSNTNPSAPSPPSSFATNPASILYNYTFQVVNNASTNTSTLQMIDAGSAKTYNIANNIEYMAILVGESDRVQTNTVTTINAPGGGTNPEPMQLPEMNRYISFSSPDLYPYRITAVRIALVVRSNLGVLASAPSSATPLNLMIGNNNTMMQYTPPLDTRLRKVFVTTIYLHSYTLPEYRMNCTPGSSSNYQLEVGGIPFTTISPPAITNNQFCGSCSTCTNFNNCETQRMTNGC